MERGYFMSSVEEKQAKIVNALIKANQRGDITWKPLENNPGCVFTQINDKFVYLDNYHSNGTDSIKVEIYANGDMADSFVDDDLSSSDVTSVTNETWFMTLTGLLESARRKSSGADEILDSLLKDLGE